MYRPSAGRHHRQPQDVRSQPVAGAPKAGGSGSRALCPLAVRTGTGSARAATARRRRCAWRRPMRRALPPRPSGHGGRTRTGRPTAQGRATRSRPPRRRMPSAQTRSRARPGAQPPGRARWRIPAGRAIDSSSVVRRWMPYSASDSASSDSSTPASTGGTPGGEHVQAERIQGEEGGARGRERTQVGPVP